MARQSRMAAVALLFLCALVPATAQNTNARLSGTVTDPSGAVIPQARIIVRNLETNLSETTTTGTAGEYMFPSLPPGSYTLSTEANGFSRYVQNNIALTVGQSAELNVQLKAGGGQTTVTVNGAPQLINTTTAEIGQVVNEAEVKDLPLNGRDPSSLVNLASGVTNELMSQAATLPTSNSFPTESGASAGGQRQGSTWYLLDGVSNMDTFAMLAAPFPNADATQEFRVVSNNFDVRYGFAPSAVVSIQTKSGTNHFHGGLFEFIRNNDFNASNWFTGAVDPLKRNQFGGYIGGPILRNQLFFFTNYQGTRDHYTASSNVAYLPTQAMLSGDFSAVPSSNFSGPYAGVFHTVNGKPNQVNPALFSPAALALEKLLPLGGDPVTGKVYYSDPEEIQTYNENTSRVDYTISDRQQLFLRSFLYNFNQPGNTIPGNILAGVSGENGTYLNLVAGHTWTINPSLLNSATLSWQELDYSTGTVERDASGKPICLSEFINVSDPVGECYIGSLSVSGGSSLYGGSAGFSAFSGNPNDTHRRYWWFTDTVTKTIGKHTITAGVDIMHRYGSEFWGGNANPSISFNGQYTGFPFADFLLGYTSGLSQGAGESGSESGVMLGLYAQDQARLRPNLTVTAGIRWDPNLPLSVAGGRGAAFVPGQQSTRYPNAPLGLIFPGDIGVDDGLMPTTYGYFEPRIGVAWQLRHGTVVRSGFGMFTSPLEDAFYNHVWDTAPFAPSYDLTPSDTTYLDFDSPWSGYSPTNGVSPFPPFASPSQIPSASATFTTPVNVSAVFARNFKLGMTQSWNLSLEQALGWNMVMHLAYVGSESFHQATTVDLNPGHFFGANSSLNGTRTTYPDFQEILEVQDGATSSYQSLQAGLEKRFTHGLQFRSNFTWSHDTDVGGSGDPSFESSVSDPYDIGHDHGPSSLNYPIVWVSDLIYHFPRLTRSNHVVRGVFGGWEVSLLYTGQSGPPFTISGGNGNNNSSFDEGQDRADVVPGMPYNVRQGGKSHWLNHYFNTSAFVENALGTPGDSEKYLMQEPPINTMDAALMRHFTITERLRGEFRWEAFNALNHPSFGQPDSSPTDSNFGQITGIGFIPPRVMQGAIKLTF